MILSPSHLNREPYIVTAVDCVEIDEVEPQPFIELNEQVVLFFDFSDERLSTTVDETPQRLSYSKRTVRY
jgi:hypothetical protein